MNPQILGVLFFAWVFYLVAARKPIRRDQCAAPTNADRFDCYRKRLDDELGLESETQIKREAIGARAKVNVVARFREEIRPSRALIVPPGSKARIRYTGPRKRTRPVAAPAASPSVIPFRAPRKRCAA